MSTTTPARRSRQDWENLAKEILPQLQNGTKMAELRERYDIGYLYHLRIAMAKLGYDLNGEPLNVRPITVKRPDAVIKEIARRRQKGVPFWLLEAESGMSHSQITRGLRDNGFAELAQGRTDTTDNGSSE